MSKSSKAVYSYEHVTPQLIKRVEAVIAEAEKHKYSASRVYQAHNEAFQKRDTPQTCSSCVRNRVRELKDWLKGMPVGEAATLEEEDRVTDQFVKDMNAAGINIVATGNTPQYVNPGAPGFVAPAIDVMRYPMGEDALPIDFTPSKEDINKGTVLYADGSKVKAGTYVSATATPYTIAVQPGGKATIKTTEEDLT